MEGLLFIVRPSQFPTEQLIVKSLKCAITRLTGKPSVSILAFELSYKCALASGLAGWDPNCYEHWTMKTLQGYQGGLLR